MNRVDVDIWQCAVCGKSIIYKAVFITQNIKLKPIIKVFMHATAGPDDIAEFILPAILLRSHTNDVIILC